MLVSRLQADYYGEMLRGPAVAKARALLLARARLMRLMLCRVDERQNEQAANAAAVLELRHDLQQMDDECREFAEAFEEAEHVLKLVG